MKKLNIAILSPSQNAYSETFIQAHKNLLDANVFYYYGALSNQYLEGKGSVLRGAKRYIYKGIDKLKGKPFEAEKKALVKSLKLNKIDVILAEYGTTAAMFLEAIKESKLPLIVHFHGYDASKYQILKTYGEKYKEVFAYSSYVIVVSQVMFNKIVSLGCPEKKLVINTYGPNDIFLKNAPTFSKQQFIAIGRFTDKKAPYYTILAFKKVLESYPKAKLIMAGVGNLLNACENLVKFYQIEESVKFVGVITPYKFLDYLKDTIAFVQHSITAKDGDMEGAPLAILESSAAGLPVVSTIHAGIPDVIIHDKTGFLVKEHDVEEMNKYMIKLISDNKLAQVMGENGRENIIKHFSIKRHIDKINELLQKAVKN